MKNPIRHGELVLIPETDTPNGVFKPVINYVASHSETGHNHVIQGKASILEKSGGTWLTIDQPTKVVHLKSNDRHGDLTLQPGVWKIKRKQEENPILKRMQQVAD